MFDLLGALGFSQTSDKILRLMNGSKSFRCHGILHSLFALDRKHVLTQFQRLHLVKKGKYFNTMYFIVIKK